MRIFYLEAEISKNVFRDFKDVFAYLGVHKIKISPRTLLSSYSLSVYIKMIFRMLVKLLMPQTAHRC